MLVKLTGCPLDLPPDGVFRIFLFSPCILQSSVPERVTGETGSVDLILSAEIGFTPTPTIELNVYGA